MSGKYIVRAECGGPNYSQVTKPTQEEAWTVARHWQQAMTEAQVIIVFGPKLRGANGYEIGRLPGQSDPMRSRLS